MMNLIDNRLDHCRPGQGGTILEISDHGPMGQRLMEMGLVSGMRVEVIRVAPLGDPIEIRIDESRLSLRRAEARHVRLGR